METSMRASMLARGAIIIAIAATTIGIACRSSKESTPTVTPGIEATPQATGTPVYGTPMALPPTPLPVERGVDDSSQGIGVYPALLSFPDTLRGREYFGTVGVMNGGSRSLTYRFETVGDAAPWLSFVSLDRATPLSEIEVAPHDTTQVMVRALVPPAVTNGEYAGIIRVLTTTSAGADAEGSGVGVNLGAEVSVRFAVSGTQRIEGQFIDAGASDVESGYPLRIQSSLVNTGNVQINPEIDVDIVDTAGNAVDHFSSADQVLFPNDRKQIVTEWSTTGRTTGERIARITVKYGALELGTKEVRFTIVPVGTFTRRGELQEVRLTNKPRAGDLAKLVAVFNNTGQIETKGKFLGELYAGDRLIEQLSSSEQLLLPGGTGELEILARVVENGTYTVKGKVNYEGRETDVQSYTFRVGAQGGLPNTLKALIAVGAAAAILALGAGGWMFRRSRAR